LFGEATVNTDPRHQKP